MTALSDGQFMPWPEKSIYGETGWRTFGLYAFGQKQRRGCALCPETARLVRRIPGMTMAGFSRLAPGAHICHLGLRVPPGCALRVGDETRQWQEGRCLVFDDSYDHEAWNRGDGVRTVLLVDFRNPARRWPLILNPQLTPEMVDFIENDHVPTQRFHQKLAWRVWRLVNRR